MHNLHFLLVKAETAIDAASQAESAILDWGGCNNWRNIGGIALALADGGASVVVNARANRSEAEFVAAEITHAGAKAVGLTADVVDADAVANMESRQDQGHVNEA